MFQQTLSCRVMETLGETLLYHYDMEYGKMSLGSWSDRHGRTTNHELRMHRLVYQATVHLMLDFLQTVIHNDEVSVCCCGCGIKLNPRPPKLF